MQLCYSWSVFIIRLNTECCDEHVNHDFLCSNSAYRSTTDVSIITDVGYDIASIGITTNNISSYNLNYKNCCITKILIVSRFPFNFCHVKKICNIYLIFLQRSVWNLQIARHVVVLHGWYTDLGYFVMVQ